jgi:hypothetical protein
MRAVGLRYPFQRALAAAGEHAVYRIASAHWARCEESEFVVMRALRRVVPLRWFILDGTWVEPIALPSPDALANDLVDRARCRPRA